MRGGPRAGGTHSNLAGVGDDGLEVDGVYQRLLKRNLLDAGVVETVNIVPDWGRCRVSGRFLVRWERGANAQPIFSSL